MQSFQAFVDFIEAQTVKKDGMVDVLRAEIPKLGLLPNIPVITVTGTNGKGSAVHALASLLIQAGYRVGTFTSPHLVSYCERIAVQLRPTTEEKILAAYQDLSSIIDLHTFNFFSILFLIALMIFKQETLDFMILEVGIGGRLDATNALEADMVILTQVALDHMHMLGNTREAIGAEKADLLRKEKIFICGEGNPPESVTAKASLLQCKSFYLGKQFGFFEHENTWDLWLPDRMLCGLAKPSLHPVSVACAVMASSLLDFRLPAQSRLQNFALQSRLPARCQRFEDQGYDIILDVAHNPAAVQHLANYIKALPPNPYTLALFGAMQDKDIASMLKIVAPLVSKWYFTDLPGPRAASSEYIAKQVDGLSCQTFSSVAQAWQALLNEAPQGSRIIIFGSFRIVEKLKGDEGL